MTPREASNSVGSSTHYGVRLPLGAADLAWFALLVELAPEVIGESWSRVHTDQETLLVTARLGDEQAGQLARHGVPLLVIEFADKHCRLRGLGEDGVRTLELLQTVACASFIQAIPPVSAVGDAVPGEAVFAVAARSPAALRLIGRLLALGRSEVSCVEWAGEKGSLLTIRVPSPPLYLLLRARDVPEEETEAYVPLTDRVHLPWGTFHPWLEPSSHGRKDPSEDALILVERSGALRRLQGGRPHQRPLFDLLEPAFSGPITTLTPEPELIRFPITLRLAPSAPQPSELWLVSPEELLALEPFIQGTPPDELSRFTLARMTGSSGTVYVLRERVFPDQPSLGGVLEDLLGRPGYCRIGGLDSLFVPSGRCLKPLLRLSDLIRLFELDRVQSVVLTESAGAPCVVRLQRLDEVPLTDWVEYVATDHRLDLDPLLELPLLAQANYQVNRPAAPQVALPPPRAPKRRAASPSEVVSPAPEVQGSGPTEAGPPEPTDGEAAAVRGASLAALREETRRLETELLGSQGAASELWHRLATLKEQLSHWEEAAFGFESALFFGSEPALSHSLVELRRRINPVSRDEQLLELAIQERHSAAEVALLGAEVLARSASPEPTQDVTLLELLIPPVARIFEQSETPCSLRLAWAVLRTIYRRREDPLGLLRARERLLGAVNHRGLRSAFDLPLFARIRLALEGEDRESALAEQGAVLDGVLSLLSPSFRELDADTCYLRLILAHGYRRLGAREMARSLVEVVEQELPAFESARDPHPVLMQLYLSHLAQESSASEPGSWAALSNAAAAGARTPEQRQGVDWLRKRSLWLRAETPLQRPSRWTSPCAEAAFVEGLRKPAQVAVQLATALAQPGLYDYERADALVRATGAALASGEEPVIAQVLSLALEQLPYLSAPSYRAKVIGELYRAAAVLGDDEALDELGQGLRALRPGERGPGATEFLPAARLAVEALRRVGARDRVRELLSLLAARPPSSEQESLELSCVLASATLLVGETPEAVSRVSAVVDAVLSERLDYATRYELTRQALEVLRQVPWAERAPLCLRIAGALDTYRDTFTTRDFYGTYRLLVLEHLVDTVSDIVTVVDHRLRAALDGAELHLRRRILADTRTS